MESKRPTVPSDAAVLVIDVQAGLFRRKPLPFEAEAVVDRINAVTAKARQAGAPVVFIQHDGAPEEDFLRPFSEEWKLDPRLVVQPGDLILRKTTCDAFYRTALENELKSRGVGTLVLTGYATDFCVDTTLRNAVSKDFRIVVVADAHTTQDGPVLKADAIRAHHNWAWAECISTRGVTVLPAAEVEFPSNATV